MNSSINSGTSWTWRSRGLNSCSGRSSSSNSSNTQLRGAAAPTRWPSQQAPLPPQQQSVEAQQLPLLSLPEKYGDEQEEVVVAEKMYEVGRVMARDGEKEMMGSMRIDKQKDLLQQQPQPQQRPQLPGAAAPDPWPPPMSADLDESNSEREIGKHAFLVLFYGGRATAGSFAFGKCKAKGGQNDREQDRSDWKRQGIDTGWSFSTFEGWGHETPARRLTRLRRVRVREKR